MDSALENDMREILRALSTLRVPAAPEEYDIHALVAAALERAGIAARHEARLCPGCRIDFLCGHVGIEVKKNRPPRASLMKQDGALCRQPGYIGTDTGSARRFASAARGMRRVGRVRGAGKAVGGGTAMRRKGKSLKAAMQTREMNSSPRDRFIEERYGSADEPEPDNDVQPSEQSGA